MPVGAAAGTLIRYPELEFTVVDSVKILGRIIDSKIEKLEDNFENIFAVIKKSILFWERFNLTIPGRINITKSLLLSQINYLGCVMLPSNRLLDKIQRALDDFSLGSIRFARERLCLKPEQGGLGLFNLKEFLEAQQCLWVLRANQSCRDIWRVNLNLLGNGNCLCVSNKSINKAEHPILFGFASAFEKLRIVHDKRNDNHMSATLLDNSLIFRGRGERQLLNTDYLGISEEPELCKKIAFLTIEECYGILGFLDREEFLTQLNINVSLDTYSKLKKAITHFVNRLRPNTESDGSVKTIGADFRIKKPGKKIRVFFGEKKSLKFQMARLTQYQTFFRITEIDPVNAELFGKNFSLWKMQGMTNRMRMFFIKFYNNILGINVRTAHFGENQSRLCFFCTNQKRINPNDETFIHLFLDCPSVKIWHAEFLQKCFPELRQLTPAEERKLWFLGYFSEDFNLFLCVAVLTFQFYIWEHKLKKTHPSHRTLYRDFSETFSTVVRNNTKIKKASNLTNFSLCRPLGLHGRDKDE